MSWRKLGESEENQRPPLMASRSSWERMGSSEIIAFPLVLINIPAHWYYVLSGFVLFRIFDIGKPWPIRWIDQNISGGLGIMLDDVLAALYAWLILYVIVLVVG